MTLPPLLSSGASLWQPMVAESRSVSRPASAFDWVDFMGEPPSWVAAGGPFAQRGTFCPRSLGPCDLMYSPGRRVPPTVRGGSMNTPSLRLPLLAVLAAGALGRGRSAGPVLSVAARTDAAADAGSADPGYAAPGRQDATA